MKPLLLILSALGVSACGTLMNVTTPVKAHQPYGGVVISADYVTFNANEVANGDYGRSLWMIGSILDIPLSFVGDTVTLPYTLYKASQ